MSGNHQSLFYLHIFPHDLIVYNPRVLDQHFHTLEIIGAYWSEICLRGPLHHLLHVVIGDLRGFLQVVDDGSVATDHRITDAVDVTLADKG